MMNTGTGIAPARNRVLKNTLNRLLDETFGTFAARAPISEEPGAFTTWTPLCDIYETDKNIAIKMEIPEVKKEDISVTFDNNVLTINGERKPEEVIGRAITATSEAMASSCAASPCLRLSTRKISPLSSRTGCS
jgi:HSP20 family molecular chaperone IbpA